MLKPSYISLIGLIGYGVFLISSFISWELGGILIALSGMAIAGCFVLYAIILRSNLLLRILSIVLASAIFLTVLTGNMLSQTAVGWMFVNMLYMVWIAAAGMFCLMILRMKLPSKNLKMAAMASAIACIPYFIVKWMTVIYVFGGFTELGYRIIPYEMQDMLYTILYSGDAIFISISLTVFAAGNIWFLFEMYRSQRVTEGMKAAREFQQQ